MVVSCGGRIDVTDGDRRAGLPWCPARDVQERRPTRPMVQQVHAMAAGVTTRPARLQLPPWRRGGSHRPPVPGLSPPTRQEHTMTTLTATPPTTTLPATMTVRETSKLLGISLRHLPAHRSRPAPGHPRGPTHPRHHPQALRHARHPHRPGNDRRPHRRGRRQRRSRAGSNQPITRGRTPIRGSLYRAISAATAGVLRARRSDP